MKVLFLTALIGFVPICTSGEDLTSPTKPLLDQVEEVIKPAKDEFLKAKAAAQERYKKILDAEMEKATKAGSFDDVTALKKEMEEYAADESKWKSAAHKASIKKYNADLESPAKKYLTALDAIIKDQVRKKNLDVAAKIKEMKEDGIEGVLLPGSSRRINLMPLIDPQLDTVKGTWRREKDELKCNASMCSRIVIPYTPPEEYDFIIAFTRIEGTDTITQILFKNNNQFNWSIGSFKSTVTGFELVKDKRVNDNSTTKHVEINNNKLYTSIVRVRNDSVSGFIDDKDIVTYKTNYNDLNIHDLWRLNNSSVLGIGSNLSAVSFQRIELLEISGKGKRLR